MLSVQNLRKKFGDLVAVEDLSIEVSQGRIFGLLGPNGAGKTTSISMISGLLTPTSGSVHVDGIALRSNPREVKRRLGVVPQEIALYEELTARENLSFWGGIYGLRGAELKRRMDGMLDLVGLAERAREPVKNFSGGMKRRLNLALGLVHEPKLLLLDEPTVGIDPQARINILEVVRNVVDTGRTVLYTTHYLEEAESLCDELAIMDHGKLLAQGSISELKAQLGEGTLVVLSGRFEKADVLTALDRLSGFRPIEVNDAKAMLLLPRSADGVGQALEQLFATGLQLDDVSIKEPNLQDLFIKLTGRDLRD